MRRSKRWRHQRPKFQSLLWWIYHFDLPYALRASSNVFFVSILVMMDLSFWSYFEDDSDVKIRSFNPCYDGFIILIPKVRLWNQTHSDVSILVMMDLSFWYSIMATTAQIDAMFQSLLWWIYHFDRSSSSISQRIVSIVSILVMMDLSFWCQYVRNPHHLHHVSILVMMDLSFWCCPWCRVGS